MKTDTPEYSNFIFLSHYARWLEDKGRRETWEEAVDRYFGFFRKRYPNLNLNKTQTFVENLWVMPSMRALWSAGPSLARCNVAGYNCSYLAVDSIESFSEAMYILMSGCGVGFSVERQYINQLPCVPEKLLSSGYTIVVEDSRKGWAQAFHILLNGIYNHGEIYDWDLSQLRPAGARLYTSGGTSSGPDPLRNLFEFTVHTFKAAAGRRLNSLECHDLMCKIGEIVVSGGVRRSALISLSNLSDNRLRHAKAGSWYDMYPHRSLANNSVSYTEKPDFNLFFEEWKNLFDSKSGERGIFNRTAAQNKATLVGRSKSDFGTNPCGEISLRNMQFCNLSEVIVRPEDTHESLLEKVEHATILGTLQATLTDFGFLRPTWRENCEEERLLGVSLTGIRDHVTLGNYLDTKLASRLNEMRAHARTINQSWAQDLSINRAAAITTVKPSGTVSQLVSSSSGIHARYSKFYIRRVRLGCDDAIAKLLISSGVPHEQDQKVPNTWVFSFPVRAPEQSTFSKDVTSESQCELWKIYNEFWAEHSVSCSIYYKEDEFLGLGQWVWDNFDHITGLSFFPQSDHIYAQAPYEEITEARYLELAGAMPVVDWSRLAEFEKEDSTEGHKTLACTGNSCELV